MKENSKTLQGLALLLPQITRQRGWEDQLDLHSIFVNWQELVDEDMAAHCRPLKIVKRVLWLEAENSSWLQQFQYQTVFTLGKLNSSLRKTRLKGLRFCVAEKAMEDEGSSEPALRYQQPLAADIAAFESCVGSISDKDAREALFRFWYLSRACKKM